MASIAKWNWRASVRQLHHQNLRNREKMNLPIRRFWTLLDAIPHRTHAYSTTTKRRRMKTKKMNFHSIIDVSSYLKAPTLTHSVCSVLGGANMKLFVWVRSTYTSFSFVSFFSAVFWPRWLEDINGIDVSGPKRCASGRLAPDGQLEMRSWRSAKLIGNDFRLLGQRSTKSQCFLLVRLPGRAT